MSFYVKKETEKEKEREIEKERSLKKNFLDFLIKIFFNT